MIEVEADIDLLGRLLVPDLAGWRRCVVVQADDVVGLGEAGEQTVFKHGKCAEADFFGGLEDHHQRAFPFGLAGDEFARRANPRGHVDVMAAGVHHACIFA